MNSEVTKLTSRCHGLSSERKQGRVPSDCVFVCACVGCLDAIWLVMETLVT